MFRSCIDVIVIRVKVSRDNEPFYLVEIDSAEDTSQPPNWEICMDKSHLLHRYTSVQIEATNSSGILDN